MKFTTNFSEYPYRLKRRAGIAVWTGALATVVFLVFTYFQARESQIEAARIGLSIDRLRHSIDKEEGSRGGLDQKSLDQKVELVNDILLKKAFSWTGFLNDLEKATPKDISIKKIEPHFNDNSVNLSGEALTLKDLTRLILSLEGQNQFNNVFLLDQKQTKENRTDFLIHLNYQDPSKERK